MVTVVVSSGNPPFILILKFAVTLARYKPHRSELAIRIEPWLSQIVYRLSDIQGYNDEYTMGKAGCRYVVHVIAVWMLWHILPSLGFLSLE